MAEFAHIQALSFDADQTLWDFAGVYRKALEATAAAMTERGDVAAGQVSAAALKAVRDEVVVEFRGQPHSLERVRERSFEVFLRRQGHGAPASAAAELIDLYLQVRFDSIELYPEVVSSLARLKPRFKLGLLSNGNTYPERCGLPGVFDAHVMGPDHGVEKPDPRAFELLAEKLHVPLDAVMHIGDDWDDIEGANAVGAVSVYINRTGKPPQFATEPDLVVTSLTELEVLLASGTSASHGRLSE